MGGIEETMNFIFRRLIPVDWLRVLFYRRISDQRRYTRVPFSVKVTRLSSGNFTYYHATNISSGGIFLKASEVLPKGTVLSLQFKLPEQEEDIQVQAMVVRFHQPSEASPYPAGVGLKFLDLKSAHREAIERFIARQL